MKTKIVANDEFIINSIVEAIKRLNQEEVYSNTIESGISELVRIYMREIAQETKPYFHKGLLHQAYSKAENVIQKRLEKYDIEFKFNKYRDTIKKNLKYSAKEISDLGEELKQSKESDRIGKKTAYNAASSVLHQEEPLALPSNEQPSFEISTLTLSTFIDCR